MKEIIAHTFLVFGAFFMLIAAIGLARFPDIYTRMSATTKASTFGVGFNLLAAAIHFDNLGVTMRILATLLFLFITAPIAAHVIGRTAYINRVPLWNKSVCDELKGRYNKDTKELASLDEQEQE